MSTPHYPLSTLAAALVWSASVLIPLFLFLATIHDAGAIPRFFKLTRTPLIQSLEVSTFVGVIGILLAAAAWQALSSKHHPHPRSGSDIRHPTSHIPHILPWAVRLFLITGLMPGVLIGAAVNTAINTTPGTDPLADSLWCVVIGHLARFGCVPILIGCWLAATEPPRERELRALDGALTLRGWWHTSLPVQAGALIAAGLATFALSLHEIESAIILQPPGSPSLAQVLLFYLHQLRMQDLSAAGVVLVGGGLVVAAVAGVGFARTAGVRR